MIEQVFFFYFAFVIAAASVLVVAVRNPIYSALSLLIMFTWYRVLQAEEDAEATSVAAAS